MKKKIPYILAMILMIPFFVLAALSLGAQGSGNGGKEIVNTNMSWTVVKEDGVLEESEGMPVYVNIEKDGRYSLSFSWDVEEPGFLTAITITDENGKCVYCDTAFQVQISNKLISLKQGKYIINTVFLATEDEYRKLNAENKMITDQKALEDYISAVGFDTFKPDSECHFTFEVKLTQSYSAPAWVKALFVAMGLIIIALTVITLVTNKKSNDNIKDGLDNITIAYAVFSLVVTCVQLFISLGISFLPIADTPGTTSLISFAMIVISVDIVGFPLILGLTRNIPTREIQKQKFGFFKFLPYIFMTFGIGIPLSFVGSIINTLLTLPFGGSNTSVILELLNSSSLLPRILVVGILAPIFEELIFRKVLIDRLSRYSTFLAIFVSGLFFGLYHGNFSQFFFATGIGLLFAFLYSKTGKIHLTIILHMIVNLFTSVITTTALQKVHAANPNMDVSQEFLMSHPEAFAATILMGLTYACLALLTIIGIIIFIIFAATRKFRLEKVEGEPTIKEALKALFTSKYAWLFILSTIGLFVFSHLPTILGI
ncbi:MAG: CPBP family intramembrane metalloprotease [Lachnospiraceae bacterium]|nr:CPBP family intramembrane metalloprotease [Lachnospiraceae bacterium]